MSFIYPRTVTITRAPLQTGFGALPWSEMQPDQETVIFAGLPASVQQKATGSRPDAGLPADTTNRTGWRVFIPLYAAPAPGLIMTRDIITDDLGFRYQVTAPYWNSLGFNCLTERLES